MEKGICLIERLYVPYGQTVRFETLRVDKLIVDGNLIVEGKISAVICRGKGSVQVGDMEVDKLRLSSVTCEGRLKAREVISRRVYAESVHISKRIWCLISLVAKYLVAPCVATPLLGCENGDLQDCVIVPQRDYSLRRFRRTVCWHRFLSHIRARGKRLEKQRHTKKAAIQETDARAIEKQTEQTDEVLDQLIHKMEHHLGTPWVDVEFFGKTAVIAKKEMPGLNQFHDDFVAKLKEPMPGSRSKPSQQERQRSETSSQCNAASGNGTTANGPAKPKISIADTPRYTIRKAVPHRFKSGVMTIMVFPDSTAVKTVIGACPETADCLSRIVLPKGISKGCSAVRRLVENAVMYGCPVTRTNTRKTAVRSIHVEQERTGGSISRAMSTAQPLPSQRGRSRAIPRAVCPMERFTYAHLGSMQSSTFPRPSVHFLWSAF